MEFWTVVGYLFAASILFLVYQITKFAYLIFREYFVLWNVARGASDARRNISTKVRLHAYVCQTRLLDEVSVNELYTFLKGMMDSDFSINDFHQVVLSYTYAIMCRERKDGSLRGVLFLGVDQKTSEGQSYTLIRLGLSFFQNYYRGGPLLYFVLAYHILKELFFHPLTPIYVCGKCFSYKSYIAVGRWLGNVYPVYNKETPSFIKQVMDDFMTGLKSSSEVYDSKTCVLKRERSSMKGFVAPIASEDRADPHIHFFEEQNPGWTKGHQMCVIARVAWSDVYYGLAKLFKRNLLAKNESLSAPTPAAGKIKRQFTFQSENANRYSVVYSEMDFGGHHSPREESSQYHPDMQRQMSFGSVEF